MQRWQFSVGWMSFKHSISEYPTTMAFNQYIMESGLSTALGAVSAFVAATVIRGRAGTDLSADVSGTRGAGEVVHHCRAAFQKGLPLAGGLGWRCSEFIRHTLSLSI